MTYRQWEIPIDALSPAQKLSHEYWQGLGAADDLPAVGAFEMLRLPAAVLPLTHVADVLDKGAEFKYRYWGSGFWDHFGYDGTGMTFADLRPAQLVEPVREATKRAVDERRPIAMMSEFERGINHDVLGFQRILRMPLVSDDGDVAQVVSVVEFMKGYQESQQIISESQAQRF